MKQLYFLIGMMCFIGTANAQVVISQVYGGGGNSGATYTHDFIELFNRGTAPVTLSGYTLQYASATGTFSATNRQTLPNITIQPGKYFLIQQAQGNGGTTPLPSPDLIPTDADNNVILALSGTNGKVVLASNNNLVTSATDSNVVDFVGYGTANMYEGAAAVAALSNTTAAIRANEGCTDTNSNSTDFAAATPAPRNSSSPAHSCGVAGTGDFTAATLVLFPNPVKDGILHIQSIQPGEMTVVIYDMLGKAVLAETTTGQVNISELNNGIYFVNVTVNGKTEMKKLVVQ